MNNKNQRLTLIVVVVVVILGFGAAALKKNDNKASSDMPTNSSAEKTTPANNTAQESNMVTYKGFAVVQKTIKIKKGTTVTWTNEDNAKHDVTPDTETADFKAGDLFGKGETYKHTFNTVGTFSYHCSPHPYMKGNIEVTE